MKILHFFPDLMNLYGDYGNLVVLRKHLEDQGFEVSVEAKEVGDDIKVADYDMLYMGSGTERNLMIALREIRKYRSELRIFIEEGKPVLFTGNAMELFGKKIDEEDGLGFLPFTVKQTKERYTGDVIVKSEEFGEVVGFINKCSIIENGENDKLFDYIFKDNNLNDNDYEGYRYQNLIGTHLIGPVLVKNPGMMEWLVRELCGVEHRFKDVNYPYENDSYEITLSALKERIR